MAGRREPSSWVLLSYRLPREPSTPRITVWRKLDRLGVARLGDGLVGLPADARTREQIEWLATDIRQADGTATVWIAAPASTAEEGEIIERMRTARAVEYQTVIDKAATAATADGEEKVRAVRQLRDELHRIARRDFFPPPERDRAEASVEALAVDARDTRKRRARSR
jgi:hypothetical protein